MTRSAPPPPLFEMMPGTERTSSARRAVSGGDADELPIEDRVRAAQAGDRTAMRELLARALPRARNLIRYLVRGDQEVDDIAQDALMALVRGLHTYRGDGAFPSWVDRIVVRVTFAHLRRRRAEPQLTVLDSDALRVADVANATDEYLTRRRAAAILDELAEEQRVALVLHHVLEMSVPEIAVEVGAPAETVRSRLRLARTRLRALGEDAFTKGES